MTRLLRRSAVVVLPVLVVAVALSAWLGLRALAAQRHLEQARDALSTARTALLDRRVDDARAAAASATRETTAARQLTGDPVWRVSAGVPGLGRSLANVRVLTAAVDDVAREVLPPALQAAGVFAGQDLRAPDGSIDLALVNGAQPAVAQAATGLREVAARLDALPTAGVLAPVRRATVDLQGQLTALTASVDSARRVADLAPPLLGADRPRRYFVLVQQPGESRGTGGLTGGFAVLEADAGRVRVTQTGSNTDLVNGPVPVPAGISDQYAYEYGGNLGFSLWQNVNLSPDLPAVARVVAARWKAQSGQQIDGVVAMDPTAVAALLAGSGPVDVGGRMVAPAGLVRYLTVEQYAGLSLDDSQAARKDALAGAARSAGDRVSGASGGLQQLLRGLADAVGSGHLRMASDDPALAPGLAAMGVDGALPAGDAPVAYAVVQNATQGKLDSFLERHVRYTAGPCAGTSRASTIAVELRNDAPAAGLPAYLTIRATGGASTSSTDSAVLLQTYASRGARLVAAELDGVPVVNDLHAGLEAGLPFWGLSVDLPRGAARVLTLHLQEPVTAGAARVPEQPLVRPLLRTVEVPPCTR